MDHAKFWRKQADFWNGSKHTIDYVQHCRAAVSALERVAALERERNTLYDAMREVCKIIGGYTTDGTSVKFLAYVPESVRLTVGKLERELAEARRDGARLTHIIEESNKGKGWLTSDVWDKAAALCPLDAKEADNVQKWIRAVIDADMGGE